MRLSIVIPAYNEQDRIGTILEQYCEYFSRKYKSRFEIIVAVEGTDRTRNIVRTISLKYPGYIRCLYSRKKQGKGGAILSGLKACCGDIVGFVDADESVSPRQYQRLIGKLGDCVVASRKVKGSKILRRQPLIRRTASFYFNVLVNLLFNLGVKDTQCGAKVFRREVVIPILPELRCKGFEFDVELLYRIRCKGFDIKEIPITWKHESGSSFSFRNAPRMFLNLLKLRIVAHGL